MRQFSQLPVTRNSAAVPRKMNHRKMRIGVMEECVDQARPLAYRDNVAIADRRNGDHREIDDIRETEVAVDIVPQTVPIEPQQRKGDARSAAMRPRCGSRARANPVTPAVEAVEAPARASSSMQSHATVTTARGRRHGPS